MWLQSLSYVSLDEGFAWEGEKETNLVERTGGTEPRINSQKLGETNACQMESSLHLSRHKSTENH
jgi:hypothetical protein